MSPITIERHALGPRVYVLGRRVHEVHAGIALAVVAGLCVLLHAAEMLAGAIGLVAAWLIVKDWRDLHPATRDTAAWSFGVHRCPGGVPARPARERVPALAGLATAVVGAINVVSLMTGDLPERARDVLALAPAADVRLAHALALPGGLALLGLAMPIARRRRRALHLAVALLAALAAINVFKALDVDVAAVSLALAGLLWSSRAAFSVAHEPVRARRALWRAAALLGGTALAGMGTMAAAASHVVGGLPLSAVPGAALHLLTLSDGLDFRDRFGWLDEALGIMGAGSVAGAATLLLAPLRPRLAGDARERLRTADLVRRHGSDTLSAFKLRQDLARRFSPDGRAMLGYRVKAGALLIAGDPVGAPDAVPALMQDVVAFARRHGLALGAVGASQAFADVARRAGLRRIYLGDEAILPAGPMDLSGGAMKSLRKAVNRVRRYGFQAELRTAGELTPAALAELERLSEAWRGEDAERGFSMAHDSLCDDLLHDASVVLARDVEGRIRGFLHFVPVYGRAAVSLAFMRRDRDTPNGLNDFLVVEAARLLGERGIEELSLNFAVFARWLREPANGLERAAARVVRVGDRWFQIERLLRFNAKFRPRWQPRYLLFAGPAQVPRVALGTMWAEGHLAEPSLRRRGAGLTPRAAGLPVSAPRTPRTCR